MTESCQMQVETYVFGEHDMFDQEVFEDPIDAIQHMVAVAKDAKKEGEIVSGFYLGWVCDGDTVNSTYVSPFRVGARYTNRRL